MSTQEKRDFNKNYLIRYYPDSRDTNYNQLVGVQKMKELIGDDSVYQGVLRRVENNTEDKLDVRLRRGIRFTFVRH